MWEKAQKVLIGALIAGGGAFLTYLAQWVSGADLGVYGPLAAAVIATLINALRKLSEHVSEQVLKDPFEGDK
jgi:hypothetical protein